MTSLNESYDQLLARSKDLTILRSASTILAWDMETKMPPRGLGLRSQQLALMDVIGHDMLVDTKVPALLEAIENDRHFGDLELVQRRNVQLIRRGYDDEAKLPQDLVRKMAEQNVLSIGSWKKAKAAKDFGMFKNDLSKTIELRKRAAEILQRVKGVATPYDALIDLFEPGMTSDKITEAFTTMRHGLMATIKKVNGYANDIDRSVLDLPVPIEAQKMISQKLMDFIGYDTTGPNAAGRLDETEHPFSNGYFDDVRITTHYYEDKFTSSLFSVLHEGGHALYEEDLPREWMYQPVGSACSYGIHESQSRFVENIVGRSPEFLGFLLPGAKKLAGSALDKIGLDTFVPAVNEVYPSKIRIEADEATYGLHIIIRFELERDLFNGHLGVDELPQAWNERYEKYLGVEIENDSKGVMQDTHWASGLFGYFPSYALGNIYGGMFLKKMERDLPDWRGSIGNGDFMPIKQWLKDNIHSRGALYDPADLVRLVTGDSLDVGPFINYLDSKYERIYG
jgi:carboxypeptidase Taq